MVDCRARACDRMRAVFKLDRLEKIAFANVGGI